MTKLQAWFVCRHKDIVDDVNLPIRDGCTPADEQAERDGRWLAIRQFKRRYDLHPCVKVEAEFMRVEPFNT